MLLHLLMMEEEVVPEISDGSAETDGLNSNANMGCNWLIVVVNCDSVSSRVMD